MCVRMETGLGRELRSFGEDSVPKTLGRSQPPVRLLSHNFWPLALTRLLLCFFQFCAIFYSDRLLWTWSGNLTGNAPLEFIPVRYAVIGCLKSGCLQVLRFRNPLERSFYF